MSLINDALKRAKRAQKGPASPPPPLRPVEGRPPPPSDAPVLLVIGVLFVLGLSALVYMVVAFKRGHGPLASNAATATPVAVTATPAPAPTAVAQTPVVASPTSAPPTASAASAPAAPPVDLPPLPKLQGIFYNPTQPAAVIDGMTVKVGNHISGFEVVAITQDNVTVTALGQTNVLNLLTQ